MRSRMIKYFVEDVSLSLEILAEGTQKKSENTHSLSKVDEPEEEPIDGRNSVSSREIDAFR